MLTFYPGISFSYPGGFSPLIFSPALWLKADAGTLQTVGGSAATADGDPVGQLLDQSGNGHHVSQATSTKRGTLKTGIQNGLPAIRFDGVDDFLQSAAFTLAQPWTLVIACRWLRALAGAGEYAVDGLALNSAAFFRDQTTGAQTTYAGAFGPTVTAGATTAAIYALVWNGVSTTLQYNGNAANTGNAGTGTPGGITIGIGADGSQVPANVDCFEVLAFGSALAAGDRTSLINYLNGRWGIY